MSLASREPASALLSVTPLRFLATVDTAKIPLYLAAGPSLDVWTTSEDSEEWFSSILLGEPAATNKSEGAGCEWWACARAQSPIGILVQVEGGQLQSLGPKITEILFYGTIASPAPGALPTPPSSSPDHPPTSPDRGFLPELRVHALPLSSDLLYKRPTTATLPVPPALSAAGLRVDVDPQFLPPTYTSEQTSTSPKRKRDIFEEASQARKKAKSKGGEGIAAAAASALDSQFSVGHRKSLSVDTKTLPRSDSRPGSAHALARPSNRPLSRSPSVSSDSRPISRRGAPEGQTKRSALSQVATVPLQPEEPTTESRNKEALSRVVMAAMRMQGLQPRRKNKSQGNSVAAGIHAEEQLSEQATGEEAVKDEEYKLIYHQTYKSAVLAFRKHMWSKPLHSQPDRLRDVVERLLAIFCTDPLAQPWPDRTVADTVATPGREHLGVPGSTHSRASPFDMPSGSRQVLSSTKVATDVHTGSPIRRRKQEMETVPG